MQQRACGQLAPRVTGIAFRAGTSAAAAVRKWASGTRSTKFEQKAWRRQSPGQHLLPCRGNGAQAGCGHWASAPLVPPRRCPSRLRGSGRLSSAFSASRDSTLWPPMRVLRSTRGGALPVLEATPSKLHYISLFRVCMDAYCRRDARKHWRICDLLTLSTESTRLNLARGASRAPTST